MAPEAKKMTEYERRRLENIKKNDEMLAALKIRSHLSQLSSLSKRDRPQTKSYKLSPEKKQKSSEPVVLRRSLRSQGLPPPDDGLKDDFVEAPIKKTPHVESESVSREPVPFGMGEAYESGDDSGRVLILCTEMAPEAKKMTEYERRRLENIKRNDEMMAALKIRSHLSQLSSLSKRDRPGTKCNKLSPEKKQKPSELVVLRRSLRSQGLPAPDDSRGPVPFGMGEAYERGDDSGRVLIGLIKGLSTNSEAGESNVGSVDPDSMDLKTENVARVVTGKVVNVKFFPTAERTLVVVGDNLGNVGFWDADAREEDRVGIYMYSPHAEAVSGIVIQPFSMSKMFTSCYGGFIRMMDVEREMFDLTYTGDAIIYSISGRSDDVNSLYISEGSGRFHILDVRTGKSPSTWNLYKPRMHKSKINTIDFNSENTNLMATGSSDGTACIWDLRYITAYKPTPLAVARHARAVTSSYFSPSGKFLATTSFDNKVSVLSGKNFEDVSMIEHNNRANNWLFRGIWGWDDSYIYMGNSNRGVDVLSVPEKRIVTTLQSENMTSTPCLFDAHRYRVGMLAGAPGGGQVYIWTSS